MTHYYMPTEIFFGSDALQKGKTRLLSLGSKAFIVTGKNSARLSGALDDIIDILKPAKIPWRHFDEIEENPTIPMITHGAEELNKFQADYIIAIGGGSPLDAAKAISAGAANNLRGNDVTNADMIQKTFPLACVPITAGTGSEVTQYSVLTDPKTGKKGGFGTSNMFSRLSLLDPIYTLSMPETLTRDTAIDALSHLLEGIYSLRRSSILNPMIYKGMKLIYHHLVPCLKEPANMEHREQLMRASLYGGMAIAQSGTTLQHSIGYPLTTHLGMSHGLANGVVMKMIMDLYWPVLKTELEPVFAGLGTGRSGFYAWLDSLEMIPANKPDDEFIEKYSAQVLGSRNIANTPVRVTEETIRSIYSSLG